jgi:hypothetical protein
MIPSDIKFDGNATPPQFTDNADQVIERGTHIRVKIKGIRGEVGQMYAIATIKEDFLGYVNFELLCVMLWRLLTIFTDPSSRLESCCCRRADQPATNYYETAKTKHTRSLKKRKEYTKLISITRPKPAKRICANIVLAQHTSFHHLVGKTSEEGTNRRPKEQRKEAKNAFDIIL